MQQWQHNVIAKPIVTVTACFFLHCYLHVFPAPSQINQASARPELLPRVFATLDAKPLPGVTTPVGNPRQCPYASSSCVFTTQAFRKDPCFVGSTPNLLFLKIRLSGFLCPVPRPPGLWKSISCPCKAVVVMGWMSSVAQRPWRYLSCFGLAWASTVSGYRSSSINFLSRGH
jgi:hypothetical protein